MEGMQAVQAFQAVGRQLGDGKTVESLLLATIIPIPPTHRGAEAN